MTYPTNNWFYYGPVTNWNKINTARTDGSHFLHPLFSNAYHLVVSRADAMNSGAQGYSFYSVPRMNGDVMVDNNRMEAVNISYTITLTSGFDSEVDSIREWLATRRTPMLGATRYNAYDYEVPECLNYKNFLEDATYKMICDSYGYSSKYSEHTFRLGVLTSPLEWTMTQLLKAGTATITFRCLPQRFLFSGLDPVTCDMNDDNKFTSPVKCAPTVSKPIILATANTSGTVALEAYFYGFSLGGYQSIGFTAAAGKTYGINCIDATVYQAGLPDFSPKNYSLMFPQNGFPTFPQDGFHSGEIIGGNNYQFSEIKVYPMWWTI